MQSRSNSRRNSMSTSSSLGASRKTSPLNSRRDSDSGTNGTSVAGSLNASPHNSRKWRQRHSHILLCVLLHRVRGLLCLPRRMSLSAALLPNSPLGKQTSFQLATSATEEQQQQQAAQQQRQKEDVEEEQGEREWLPGDQCAELTLEREPPDDPDPYANRWGRRRSSLARH